MKSHDAFDAGKKLLAVHLDAMFRAVGREVRSFACLSQDSATEAWYFRAESGRVVYATPFFEDVPGITIEVFDADETESLDRDSLDFVVTGDVNFDAKAYIAAVEQFLKGLPK